MRLFRGVVLFSLSTLISGTKELYRFFNRWSVLVLLLLSLIQCGKNSNEEYFARVNDEFIRVSEFAERLEYFTRMTGIKDNLQTRENLLDQMIGERLLIQNFYDSGLDDSSLFKQKAESIRNQFYLNTFRRKAFYDTVSVAENELRRGFRYYTQKVSARHLYAATEEEANELYRQLQNGARFEELARLTFQDSTLAATGGYLGYVGKDEMEPAFEQAAFALKVGEISRPVKTKYGYSIINVEDRFFKPFVSEQEFLDAKPAITKILKREKAITAAQEFGSKISRDLDLKFNEKILQFMAARLEGSAPDSLQADIGNVFAPDLMGEIMDETLMTSQNGFWTVAQFLEKAKYTSQRQQRRIRTADDLKKFITGLVVREELLHQAQQSQWAKDKETQAEIDHAIDGYIVGQMVKMFSDTATVTEVAAREVYDKNPGDYSFQASANVREILVADEESAKDLSTRLANGERFSDLAKKYSIREWARESGGELGMAPRTRYGALADTIFSMQPGQIIGPLKILGNYSFIQLIAVEGQRPKTFEEARHQIENEILWKWRKIRLHNTIQTMRQEANIEIQNEKLRWHVFQ
ncbi:MAG: peptidylprolyl isomerase [Candidatus Zhuqueibacterota bacterium]